MTVSSALDFSRVSAGDSMFYSKYAFLIYVFVASGLLALQFSRAYNDLDGLRVLP